MSRNAPGSRILLCLPGSAEGLRWHPLSEIEKPDSGTEPIHQEHVMCSRFRGSCPSDVKSAGHPEPGFPISLSGSSAALCAPRETQKNPAARNIPGHRHTYRPLSSGHTKTRGRTNKETVSTLCIQTVFRSQLSCFLAIFRAISQIVWERKEKRWCYN